MIKAIVFDMDGVLIEARDWHYEAFSRALSHYGFELSKEEHDLLYDGLPTRVKLEKLSERSHLPRELHSSINHIKQDLFMRLAEKLCRPRAKHLFLLDQLNEDSFRMALCSNAIRQSVDLLLKKSNIRFFFEFILSNQEVECTKPHPEIYLKVQELLGVKPEETLVIEDNDNGIQAAWKSGAHVLVVDSPDELTYELIRETIADIEGKKLYA